jgi:phosphomannomutase
MDVDALLKKVEAKHAGEQITNIDGVKIDFADGWVHLRKSNTEPIVRVYAEANTEDRANALAKMMMDEVYALAK